MYKCIHGIDNFDLSTVGFAQESAFTPSGLWDDIPFGEKRIPGWSWLETTSASTSFINNCFMP